MSATGPTPVPASGGVRIGVDVGSVRVGVAVSDPEGLVAIPLLTLTRRPGSSAELVQLANLVRERAAVGVVVGLPRRLAGDEGPAARAAREYATALARLVAPVQVRLVDERLTTVSAARGLRASGVRGRRGRAVIDQAAASLILQVALDVERSTGRPTGDLVHLPATSGPDTAETEPR